MSSTAPPTRSIDSFTFACIIAHALLGWVLTGIGAVLPDLRDSLGALGSVYPLLPGAALLVAGLFTLRRPHRSGRPHHEVIRWSSGGVAVALGLIVVTGVKPVSALGAVLLASTAAVLIRLLPAALTSHHPADAQSVITSANAWGSTAGGLGPLAIGGAAAVGLGWRVGFIGPPIAACVIIVVLMATAQGSDDAAMPHSAEHPHEVGVEQPWVDAWLLLTLGILVEFSFSFFAATYLREEVHMSSAASAAGAAGFAIGMTGGRFLSVLFTWFGSLRPQYHLIWLTTGFLLMWLVPNAVTAITGLGLAGIGISLMYPTGINRLMRRFPDSVERGSARGGLASGTALLTAPAVLGGLRGLSNVRTAYLAVPALVVALFLTYRWCDRTDRRVFARR